MSRLNHKKNHIPIDDDNFDLNFSTSKNILETYEKKFDKESYKVKDLSKVASWTAGAPSTKTWRDLKTNTSSTKKLQRKCAKLQQSCNNVEELILHLDYNVTVSHTNNTSLVTLYEAQ